MLLLFVQLHCVDVTSYICVTYYFSFCSFTVSSYTSLVPVYFRTLTETFLGVPLYGMEPQTQMGAQPDWPMTLPYACDFHETLMLLVKF